MEAPRIYCSLVGTRPPEDRAVAGKESFKQKSYLPKVLFRDNIGLQITLEKQWRHLNTEQRRTISGWNHSQKAFRNKQLKKEAARINLAKHLSLQSSWQGVSNIHYPPTSQTNYQLMPHGKTKGLRKTQARQLPPLHDPRFLRLEDSLIRPIKKL